MKKLLRAFTVASLVLAGLVPVSASAQSFRPTTRERIGEMAICSNIGNGYQLRPAVFQTDRTEDGHILFRGWTYAQGNVVLGPCDASDSRQLVPVHAQAVQISIQQPESYKNKARVIYHYPSVASQMPLHGRRVACDANHVSYVINGNNKPEAVPGVYCNIGPRSLNATIVAGR